MSEPNEQDRPARPGAVPDCGRTSDEEYRPFCSKRCANIDLSRWLSGGYVIAGSAASDDGDEDGLVRLPHGADDEDDS